MQYSVPISKIMTVRPVTVGLNDTIGAVRQLLEEKGFHHLPVLDQGKLVGMVSYTDYLRVVSKIYDTPLEQYRNEQLLNAILVKEIMSEDVVCLAPSDSVEEAIRVFNTHAFHAIPVVEGNHNLVGILSTHDLIKMLEKILSPSIDYAR